MRRSSICSSSARERAPIAFGALAIGFVMQAAQKIDFPSERELGAVRHGRRLGAADNMQIDFIAVLFHHLGFLEDIEKGQVR